jgi:hypothetical protein
VANDAGGAVAIIGGTVVAMAGFPTVSALYADSGARLKKKE